MKITVNKSEFLSKLIAVSKVCKDNKIRPVLSGVKLEAGQGHRGTQPDLRGLSPGSIPGQGRAVLPDD